MCDNCLKEEEEEKGDRLMMEEEEDRLMMGDMHNYPNYRNDIIYMYV